MLTNLLRRFQFAIKLLFILKVLCGEKLCEFGFALNQIGLVVGPHVFDSVLNDAVLYQLISLVLPFSLQVQVFVPGQ